MRRIGPHTRPLRVPAYRRLFLGQVATVVGAALTAVAVQQQIYDITGSSAWLGIASLVAPVPLVVFGLIGGAIADSYDRRVLLMITPVGIALTSIGLWATALISTTSVWPVMVLLAAQQSFFAVNQPTRSSILLRIVPAELVPAANALNTTVFSIGVIAGPLLVGRRADPGRRADRRLDSCVYRQGIAILAAILLWGASVTLLGMTSVLWLAVLYPVIGGWSDLVSARRSRARPGGSGYLDHGGRRRGWHLDDRADAGGCRARTVAAEPRLVAPGPQR